MNTAFLLTGGNIGNRLQHLQTAKERIDTSCGAVVARSAVYETEAWGRSDQPPFLNQALKITTSLSAEHLLACILTIEQAMGRMREEKYGPRVIDIDILLFNKEVIRQEGLCIPHPQLVNRRFALQCLNDIAAKEVHPVLGKTITQLLEECKDPLSVKLFDAN